MLLWASSQLPAFCNATQHLAEHAGEGEGKGLGAFDHERCQNAGVTRRGMQKPPTCRLSHAVTSLRHDLPLFTWTCLQRGRRRWPCVFVACRPWSQRADLHDQSLPWLLGNAGSWRDDGVQLIHSVLNRKLLLSKAFWLLFLSFEALMWTMELWPKQRSQPFRSWEVHERNHFLQDSIRPPANLEFNWHLPSWMHTKRYNWGHCSCFRFSFPVFLAFLWIVAE